MKRGVCFLSLGILVSCAVAQEPAWDLPAYVTAAARTIVAPTPGLRRVARQDARLDPSLTDLLERRSGAMASDPVAIRIEVAGRSDQTVRRRLQALGGTVESGLDGVVYANLAADRLSALLHDNRDIRKVELQARFGAQSLTGTSPASIVVPPSLRPLQQLGQNGRGIRIGILDFGFAGYRAAGLPVPRAQMAFGTTADAYAGSTHGTECARLIHAIAPEAELVLAAVGDGRDAGEGQVLAAAQWLDTQGAKLVNVSASGYLSALDGSAALDHLIGHLSRNGSTWVVATGNMGRLHWQGRIGDQDHNGWIDVDTKGRGDLVVFEVGQAGPVGIVLNWGPRDGMAADLDAFLYAVRPDGRSELIAQSETLQPQGNRHPVETLSRVLNPGYYLLGMRGTRLSTPGTVHLFVSGATRMMPFRSEGSVGSPGTAPAAWSVGASEGLASAAYSGRGPTDDGRNKPEFLAPVLSDGFSGTSASTPFVTALSALILGARPGLDGTQLQTLLKAAARPATDGSARWGVLDPATDWGKLVGR